MIVFATLGYKHHTWLLAHIVLSAQGLYLLLISTFGRLANAEYLSFGESVLYPRKSVGGEQERIGQSWRSPRAFFTWFLVPANAFILAGGLMLSKDNSVTTATNSLAPKSLGLRATGQCIFLVLSAALSLRSVSVTKNNRIRNCTASTVSFACVFLVIRASYGFISCFVHQLNYFNPDNYYTHTGAYTIFTTTNYILGTTMEFCSAALLLSAYFIPNQHEYDLAQSQID